MITARCRSARDAAIPIAIALLAAASWVGPLFAADPSGTLRLTLEDAATGQSVPARVEVRGADGAYHVADDALNVHTAPIYVSLRDGAGIEQSVRSKEIAQSFVARLKDLERVLAEDNIEHLAARLADPNLDAVPKETLVDNRQALLEEVREAKA